MSQHPSLKSSKAGRKHRSVLKRYEKFFALKEKGVLKDDSSVFGMPKFKIVRTKIKKEKVEEKPEEVQAVDEKQAPSQPAPQKGSTPKPGKEEKKK